MSLSSYAKGIEACDGNALKETIFWKEVIQNDMQGLIKNFLNNVEDAMIYIKERADSLDTVAVDCGIATATGGGAGIAGGTMAIGGLILAPFTAGLSLGLTVGGAALGVAGGVTNLGTSIAKTSLSKGYQSEAKDKLDEIVFEIASFFELVHAIVISMQSLLEKLKEMDQDLHKLDISEKQILEWVTKSIFAVKNVVQIGVTVAETVGIAVTWGSPLVRAMMAAQKAAPGIQIGKSAIVMAGSLAAKTLTVALSAVGIGFSIWETINAADAIKNGSCIATELRKVCDGIEADAKQIEAICDILNKA